jgi:hypothetical protein
MNDLKTRQFKFWAVTLLLFATIYYITKDPLLATVPLTVLLAILTVLIILGNFSETMFPIIIGAALPMALAAAAAMNATAVVGTAYAAPAGLAIAVIALATIKLIVDLISTKRSVLFLVFVQALVTDVGLYFLYKII